MADSNELAFDGRVAIITGAAQGMGREHALLLASRGARVVVNDINGEKAAATVAEITAAGGTAVADSHDVVTQAAELVQTAVDAFGRLDIVVNNAGINRFGRFWDMESDVWWRVFDTCFKGVIEISRAAMPHLIASGSGRIINISSTALMGLPHDTPYAAAKAAIWAFTSSLAGEAAEVGVQVNSLLPSAWTPMTDDAFTDPVVRDATREQFPASAVSAFIAWLAHQDTTVSGEAFEIGGTAAARTSFSILPRIKVEAPTPEAWAGVSDRLVADGELTSVRSASDSFRSHLVFLAPELDSVLPADASDVSGH